MKLYPDFSFEDKYDLPTCGIDEVGRGPFAGPVIATSVIIIDRDNLPDGITDSKKLTAKKRESISRVLLETCLWGIGSVSVQEIDEINILQASLLAMRRSFEAMLSKDNADKYQNNIVALVDGIHPPSPLDGCQQIECIKSGDNRSISIAAASIIAKVARDDIMAEIAKEYPEYGFDSNAGYGTAKHKEALEIYGITPHHRKSFKPIRNLIMQNKVA